LTPWIVLGKLWPVSQHENSLGNFGLLIAYIIPGFTALKGLPYLAESPGSWGAVSADSTATVAGFLFGTIEAVTAGLTVSTVRWLVLDSLHHRTGIRAPAWDFALLEKNVAAFELLVHIHYRYYKSYGNMVIALLWSYAWHGYSLGWRGVPYLLLAGLFFLGSRDCLSKYYGRAGRLLSDRRKAAQARVPVGGERTE
jgi:hypothetical protein